MSNSRYAVMADLLSTSLFLYKSLHYIVKHNKDEYVYWICSMNCYNQTEMFRDLVKNKLIPFFPNVGMQKDMLSQKEQKLWQTFAHFTHFH